jgi:hypothetical protein
VLNQAQQTITINQNKLCKFIAKDKQCQSYTAVAPPAAVAGDPGVASIGR